MEIGVIIKCFLNNTLGNILKFWVIELFTSY